MLLNFQAWNQTCPGSTGQSPKCDGLQKEGTGEPLSQLRPSQTLVLISQPFWGQCLTFGNAEPTVLRVLHHS